MASDPIHIQIGGRLYKTYAKHIQHAGIDTIPTVHHGTDSAIHTIKTECEKSSKKGEWIATDVATTQVLQAGIEDELKSEDFFKTLINNSFLNVNESTQPPVDKTDTDTDTNTNDKDNIVNCFGSNWLKENDNVTRAEALVIFGPSSAGKTHCTKQILKGCSKCNLSDDTVCGSQDGCLTSSKFLVIDGGVIRESCKIYGEIAKVATDSNAVCRGVENLANPNILHRRNNIFDSDAVKHIMEDTVHRTNKHCRDKINICYPSTNPTIDKIKYLTGEDEKTSTSSNVVLVLVWQPYTVCKLLGQRREMKEGKKYSERVTNINKMGLVKNVIHRKLDTYMESIDAFFNLFKSDEDINKYQNVIVIMNSTKETTDFLKQLPGDNVDGSLGNFNFKVGKAVNPYKALLACREFIITIDKSKPPVLLSEKTYVRKDESPSHATTL